MSLRYVPLAFDIAAALIMVLVLMALDSPFGNYLWLVLAFALCSVSGAYEERMKGESK